MKKQVQTLAFNQYIPVRKDLTSKSNLKSVVESAERRDMVFTQFIKFIRTQYSQMKVLCSRLSENNYLVFNQYINDAFDLINECWSDDLVSYCTESLKAVEDVYHNPEFQESFPLECSIYEAQKFENFQNQLIEQIRQQNAQIQVFFESAEKFNTEKQKTLNYYNPNYLKDPYVELSKLYHYLQESDIKNKKLITQIEKNKVKFLSVFGNFRKVAVRNRVLFEKKIYKICALLVDGIIRTFNQFHNKLKKLKKHLQEADAEVEHSGGEDVKREKYEFFNRASSDDLFSICCLVKNICDTMHDLLKFCKEHRTKFNKKLCQSMRIQDSIPSQAFNFVFQTFQKMFSRITQIANNLSQKSKMLEQYENKLADLGNSTVIGSNWNHQSGLRKIRASGVDRSLSIPHIIYGILDDMIDPLSKLVLWGETSLAKEKKIYLDDEINNHDKTRMSIDNGAEDDFVHQQDMWMFEDWKESSSIKMPQFNKVREELGKIKAQIDVKKKLDGKEVMEPQKCQLLMSPTLEKKGILYIYQNWVKFISSEDEEMLIVPYEAISNVKVKLQVFKQNLFLYTPRGRIVFINPPKVHKCKQKISQRIKPQKNSDNNDNDVGGQNEEEAITEGGAAATPKWKQVELTPGEVSGMEARKTKVLAELPNCTTWEQIQPPQIFRNITIDQFYDEIHSDRPKQIGGKKWKSFNHFLLTHLGGNNNIEDGKFTSKGPKFYTLQDGETFETAPSFSERTNTYDHALEGFGIPLLPKFVKCKEVMKAYWVSNEQLVMLLDAYSSGVPMADSFYVRFAQHIKKKGDDVQVNYNATVVFVKDTMFKSKLQKKCLQQIKDNLPKTIKAQQNRLRSLTAKGKAAKEMEAVIEQEKELVKKESTASTGSDGGPNVLNLVVGIVGFLVIIKLFKMMFL